MKKLRIDKKFALTAAFCAALLAVPPLSIGAQALYYNAPQARPAVAGVMSDSVRLDPVAGALYRYGIAGGLSGPTTYGDAKTAPTVMSGKLRQAFNRGLLNEAQWAYLKEKLDEAEKVTPFQPAEEGELRSLFSLIYYEGGVTEVYFSLYMPGEITKMENGDLSYPMVTYTSVDIMYLPNNGAILQLSVDDNDLPAGDDLETATENFIAQLDTTLPGEWTQDEKPGDNTTAQQYIYRHSADVLWVRSCYFDTGSAFTMSVALEPEAYGGMDALNGLMVNDYGQVYNAPQN